MSDTIDTMFSDENKNLKWLPFLRQRFQEKQMGIMVGAGISVEAGVPTWGELVGKIRKIAKEPSNHLSDFKNDADATFLTEVVWQRFRSERMSHYNPNSDNLQYIEAKIHGEWLVKIKSILFQNVEQEKVEKHPYLKSLAKVVSNCGFNITFNFEDILDTAVSEYCAEKNIPLPTPSTNISSIERREGTTIFHINGIIPQGRSRKISQIIFSENAFARLLTNDDSRKREFLLGQLAEKTFVLVGLSLNDKSLTNILKASQSRNPGCHHFYIYFMPAGKRLSRREEEDIFQVNLEVYNLITLFFNSGCINDFFETISDDKVGVVDIRISKMGSLPRYVYYIIGCPAAGKTTLLANLRCFLTVEEWTRKIPETMYSNYSRLSKLEQETIDDFLDSELVRKCKMTKKNGMGITVVDRAPLDLYAFSKSGPENIAKTQKLRDNVLSTLGGSFDDGHVLFLRANQTQLALRQARRGRVGNDMHYDGKQLELQGQKIRQIYSPPNSQIFDNSNQTEEITARQVARHILFDEYNPVSFTKIMDLCEESNGDLGILSE